MNNKMKDLTKFSGEMYGTKVAIEYDHSDLSIDNVMDAFQTILNGLGYHADAFKEWVVERAEEYKYEDNQSENFDDWDVTLEDGLEDEEVDWDIKNKTNQVISILKEMEVDGETMQYILEEVGMDEQMAIQLVTNGKEEIIIKDWGGYKVIGEFLKSKQIINEAYENYKTIHKHAIRTEGNRSQLAIESLEKQLIYPQEEFISKIKTNPEFSQKWGLKIEERELSSQERKDLYDKTDYVKDIFPTDENGWNKLFDGYKIPTRLITITYNNKTIESYEYKNKI
jgi:hypothetical protein